MVKNEKLANFIVRGGLTKEEYNNIVPLIDKMNISVWKISSIVMATIFFGCLIASSIGKSTGLYFEFYLPMTILSMIFALVMNIGIAENQHTVLTILVNLCMVSLFVFGMVNAFRSTDELAVTFIVLIVAIPMLIIEKPWIITAIVSGSMITFLVIAYFVKDYSVFLIDLFDGIAFLMVAIFLHYFLIYTKFKGFLAEYKLNRLAKYDGLTGLQNELSYVTEVDETNKRIKTSTSPEFAVAMFDVNGVKPTNDTYGHSYGCAIIVEGGHYIASLFKNSKCYHVGGDEYIVKVEGEDYKNREALLKEFEEKMENYFIERNGIQLRVSLAFGISCYLKGKDPDFATVMNRADKAMYECKKVMKQRQHIASRTE